MILSTDNSTSTEHSRNGAPSLAPIYNLPNEILCMIIREAYEHDPTNCYLEAPSSLPDPFVISYVSQHMRDLAFAVPQIWSCIHIDVDRPSTLRDETYLRLLQRSRPLDVSVHFRCLKTEPQDPRPMVLDSAFPLWMHGDRIRHCTVITACPPLLNPTVGQIDMFPNIRSLHIESTKSGLVVFRDVLYEKQTTLLTSLRLSRVLLEQSCPLFHNLQKLAMCGYNMSVYYLRETLQSAPHLAHLTLDDFSVDTVDEGYSDTSTYAIELPSLRTLKMHTIWNVNVFLARLIAPQLAYLEIVRPVHEQSNVPPSEWVAYTPSLREVRVVLVPYDLVVDTIYNIRRLTPAVTALELSETLADEFLEAMTVPEPLMPLLSKLAVTFLDNHSMLVKLVDQRRKTDHAITEIRLGKPLEDDMSTEIRQSLERLVDVRAAEFVSIPRYWLRGPESVFISKEEESEDEGSEADEGDEDGGDGGDEDEIPQTDEMWTHHDATEEVLRAYSSIHLLSSLPRAATLINLGNLRESLPPPSRYPTTVSA